MTLGEELGIWLQKVDCDGPLRQKHSDMLWGTVSQSEGGTFLQNSGQPILDLGVQDTSSPSALIFTRPSGMPIS